MNNKEIWIFVFFVGTLLFNWPILETVKAVLPYYLYGAWALFVATLALLVYLKKNGKGDKDV
jgi:hypothetical protein